MKKLYLLFLLTILTMVAYSQTSKTINVETAGTLPSLISESEKYTIEELTLTGNLNGTDFRLLRDMAGNNYLGQKTEGKLKVLDISGVNIVVGGDPYLETDRISSDNSITYAEKQICTIDEANTLSNNIFVGCTFSTIHMPSSLKSIGDMAFWGCIQLASLVIPEGVETIGQSAFSLCRRLQRLELPSTLVSIGNQPFSYNSGLNAVVSRMTTPIQVGEHTFMNPKWDESTQTYIWTPSSATLYVPIGSKSKYEAIVGWTKFAKIEEGEVKEAVVDGLNYLYATGSKTASVIPGDYKSLESVTIPVNITVDGVDYKVTAIGNNAFEDCRNIKSVTINAALETIGDYAFQFVQMTDLVLPSSLKSIGDVAFGGCNQLASLVIPEGVETIGQYAFSSCSRLQRLELPSTLVSIGDEAFAGCSNLNAVVSHLTTPIQVEDHTFMISTWDKSSQTSIWTPSSATLYVPVGSKSKYEAITGWTKFVKIEEGELKEAVVDGLNYSYSTGSKTATVISGDYSGLKSVTIPSKITVDGVDYKVTAIGNNAFKDCSNIKSVIINAALETIGDYAFQFVQMTDLVLPSSLKSIGDVAFGGCNQLASLVIPEGVETIGQYAFSSCSRLQRLELPSTLVSIGDEAFCGCSNLNAVVSHMPTPIQVGEHTFMNQKWESSQTYIWNPSPATLYVPIGSKSKYEAISGWTKFAKIEEGELKEAVVDGLNYLYATGSKTASVITGDYKSLESVTIPVNITVDGVDYKVTAIGNNAFEDCGNIKSVTINAALETIGDYAFQFVQMTDLVLPSSLKSIGRWTFIYCDQLTSLVIPEGVEMIGEEAFYGCSNLNAVVSHMSTPIQVGEHTFMNQKWDESSQTSILIPSSATLYVPIGSKSKYEAISGWTKFAKIEEGELKETVVDGLNYYYATGSKTASVITGDYKSLESVTIPVNITVDGVDYKVTAIGNNAFKDCSNIKSVTINAALETIGNYAFMNVCMPELVLPSSLKSIGVRAFEGCFQLASLVIPEGVETIGNVAFSSCSRLQRLELPSTLVSIGNGAFSICSSLNAVVSHMSTPIQVGEHTFMNSKWDESTQTSILIPSSATLYVPIGSKSKYEAIPGWTKFAQIVELPASASIKVAKGMTTYTSEYNLDFSSLGDDVKAYVATGYDYDKNTIWLTRVKDVPAGTPILVQAPASETPYDIPVKASSGCYYKNMLVGNLSGGEITLSATTGDMTNYYLSNGKFLTATGTNTIGNGKAYLQIPTTPPAANVGSSQSVTLNDYGFASFCGSQDLDFTDVEGLKAFAVTGYDDANGTIWLTRVKRVSARTPLLLKGGSGASYTIPSVAVGSYYANMMKGNLSGSTITIFTTTYTSDGDMTNYYLKGNQLLKATDGGNTIGNGKAYMQIPSKHVTRSIEDIVTDLLIYGISDDEPEVISIPVARGINGDGTTNIREKLAPEQTNDVYYNLQGQRVDKPTKGLYIKNGKKVVIK